ncbi:MAG: right-handed parallel beta-helix repeat-containing protein [Armatimonadota bacterium]
MFFLRASIIVPVITLSILSCAVGADDVPPLKPAPKPSPIIAQVSDTAGLLDAISRLDPQGGTIVLAPGTYEIKDSIVIKHSNVYITGSGWNTVIRKQGEGDAIVFDGSLWCCGVKNLTIEGDPAAKKGSGIVFRNGEWSGICVVDYCQIKFFAESGVRFEGNPKKPFSSNTVSNCWMIHNLGDQLYSYHNNDYYIFGNQFGTGGERTPRSGALLQNSSAGTYTMNYHWGNLVGLRLGPGSHYNRIENNRMEQSRESGIVIGDPKGGEGSVYNIITGNTIHTNSETNSGLYPAVAAYDSFHTTFCTNQILSWACDVVKHKHGLVIERSGEWIVKDNFFRHHAEKALVYDKKAGHLIKDNKMDPDVKPAKPAKEKKPAEK